jgi:hypothetical protein
MLPSPRGKIAELEPDMRSCSLMLLIMEREDNAGDGEVGRKPNPGAAESDLSLLARDEAGCMWLLLLLLDMDMEMLSKLFMCGLVLLLP